MNASSFWDRSARGSAVLIGFVVLLCAYPHPATAKGDAGNALDDAQLDTRVAHLRDRVDQLAGRDDLLDSLHFGWFDRPYARATLTILVKTTGVLEREARLRQRGNGAVADIVVRDMLLWAEDALTRVAQSESDATFRPHRQRVTGINLTGTSATPALFAFVDRATTTRYNGSFGDLDLMASIGFRIYARLDRDLGSEETMTVRADRANALGMATVVLQVPASTGNRSSSELGSGYIPIEAAGAHALTVKPLTLRNLLERTPASTIDARSAIAVVDPPCGESWASSLARRALARGASGSDRYVVDGLPAPSVAGSEDTRLGATAAAMWVYALDGQSLGLLRGWRDLRDGSGSPFPTVTTDPALTERIAHTALDLIRFGDVVSSLRSQPHLAIAVGFDAIDPDNENGWASWTEPFWSALIERQTPFDVVNAATASAGVSARYPVIFPLQRDDVEDMNSTLVRLERRLVQEVPLDDRVTARELDGRLADDAFVRAGQTPGRGPCIAVANLSNRERHLKLGGGPELGPSRDAISGEYLGQADKSFSLSPWQVRVLRPAD